MLIHLKASFQGREIVQRVQTLHAGGSGYFALRDMDASLGATKDQRVGVILEHHQVWPKYHPSSPMKPVPKNLLIKFSEDLLYGVLENRATLFLFEEKK